jgi:hypothetical protein
MSAAAFVLAGASATTGEQAAYEEVHRQRGGAAGEA